MVKGRSRDEFISDNMLLVHSICRRFAGRGIEYDDLFQVGCIGLVKAVDNFDEDRGLQFSTYAVPVIMGEVRRMFRDGGSIKVSRSVKELGLKISRQRESLETKLGREATVSELAEFLGVTAEEITEAVCATQPTVSLTVDNDSQENIELQIPDITSNESIDNKIMIDSAFKMLTETERQIIKYRYYNSMTQSEIAKKLSISQVQVSRTERKILLKLREILAG